MSDFDATKDAAAQKAEETKGFGQQKAGEAHQATLVSNLTKEQSFSEEWQASHSELAGDVAVPGIVYN